MRLMFPHLVAPAIIAVAVAAHLLSLAAHRPHSPIQDGPHQDAAASRAAGWLAYPPHTLDRLNEDFVNSFELPVRAGTVEHDLAEAGWLMVPPDTRDAFMAGLYEREGLPNLEGL